MSLPPVKLHSMLFIISEFFFFFNPITFTAFFFSAKSKPLLPESIVMIDFGQDNYINKSLMGFRLCPASSLANRLNPLNFPCSNNPSDTDIKRGNPDSLN